MIPVEELKKEIKSGLNHLNRKELYAIRAKVSSYISDDKNSLRRKYSQLNEYQQKKLVSLIVESDEVNVSSEHYVVQYFFRLNKCPEKYYKIIDDLIKVVKND